jgi:signal transduction histidine kinase/ActR/RegA family two-component response regulator
VRTPDLDVPFEPVDRIEVEQNLQLARLALLTAPALLLLSRGADGLPYAASVVVGVLLLYGGIELLRRRPQTLLRFQLALRLVDCFVASLVLLTVYRSRGDTHLDFVYLLFVVAAAATHGQRGGLVLAGAGGLAVLATRVELVASGYMVWQVRHLTDAAFFTLFFAGIASVVALLMRKSGEVVARREQLWRAEWVQREASERQQRALAEQRKRLFELSQATIATLSVDDVVRRVLETLREVVHFDVAGVYWLDGSARVLRPAVLVGAAGLPTELQRFEVPVGQGIFGTVAQTGRGELVPNAHLDPRSVYPPGVMLPVEHMLCLPLPGREGTLGIVHAVRTADPPFGQDEFELVRLFVTHAGIAVENARLFEQATALAQTEKLRALGQMASGVAHDLNQSLALIAGYCDLALARLDGPPADAAALRETLGIVAQAAMNGGKTVNGLLTFARSHPEGDPEPIDLRGLLDEVARLTSPRWRDAAQAEGRPIGLEVEAAGGLTLLGWPASLKAAFTNLVLNAVDALPAGGTIRLEASRRGHEVVLEVSDTGVGMAAEVQARVFEPFFSTKGATGTGLGLAMVFGVVEQHGGRIALSSTPGEGTTFRLAFPAAAASPSTPRESVVEDAHVPAEGECPGLRVLVVDDEPQLTRVAALILGREGHDVTTAASGEAALERVREERFDVLVSDVSMGAGMNGWELARRVRQRCPGMRIVLATGYGAAIDPAEAARRGVDAVVAKPYRARTLGEALLPPTGPGSAPARGMAGRGLPSSEARGERSLAGTGHQDPTPNARS